MLPAISPAVISHLAMPISGVRRYAAALQSLVSAGARDRLARVEEPVVRRLCAGGKWIRTIGSAGEGPDASCVGSLSLRLFGWRRTYQRRHRKIGRVHAGPMVRIRSLHWRVRGELGGKRAETGSGWHTRGRHPPSVRPTLLTDRWS